MILTEGGTRASPYVRGKGKKKDKFVKKNVWELEGSSFLKGDWHAALLQESNPSTTAWKGKAPPGRVFQSKGVASPVKKQSE